SVGSPTIVLSETGKTQVLTPNAGLPTTNPNGTPGPKIKLAASSDLETGATTSMMSSQFPRNSELTVGLPTLRFFGGWAPQICVRLATKLYTTTTISLTSLPYLRDNHYIAQPQCSHLL